jgi:hypothetical protein
MWFWLYSNSDRMGAEDPIAYIYIGIGALEWFVAGKTHHHASLPTGYRQRLITSCPNGHSPTRVRRAINV